MDGKNKRNHLSGIAYSFFRKDDTFFWVKKKKTEGFLEVLE